MSPSLLALTWQSCPPRPLVWVLVREHLLQLFLNPLGMVGLLGLVTWLLHRRRGRRRASIWWLPCLLGLSYLLLRSPIGTAWLTPMTGLQSPAATQAVVLVGRGPEIARATTLTAAFYLQSNLAPLAYISGDTRYPAQLLLGEGIASDRIWGDSCARTTWENATLTFENLSPRGIRRITLITDPWQLPRATAAFRKVGFSVTPVAAKPTLDPENENRLAIREAAATLLYTLLGRNV